MMHAHLPEESGRVHSRGEGTTEDAAEFFVEAANSHFAEVKVWPEDLCTGAALVAASELEGSCWRGAEFDGSDFS